jgi:hypothetical protein
MSRHNLLSKSSVQNQHKGMHAAPLSRGLSDDAFYSKCDEFARGILWYALSMAIRWLGNLQQAAWYT